MLSEFIAIIVQIVVIYFLIKIAFKITKFFIKLAFYILALAVALNILRILIFAILMLL